MSNAQNDPQVLSAEIVAISKSHELKTEEAIAEAERRAALFARLTAAAIRRTYPQDWIDFSGSPYLGAPGAERLRTLFGISIRNIETRRYEERDKEGTFWFYVVTADAEWRGDTFASMGTCSSRDQFFRTRYQDGKRITLEAAEVDPTNIVKAAYSNMVANAVTRVLGLRDLTWQQLEEYGVEKGAGGVVVYRDRKPAETPASPAAAPPSAKASKVAALIARFEELLGPDEAAWKPYLMAATAYPAGTSKATGKAYNAFDGVKTIAELRKRRDPERGAAIALGKIEEMVKSGDLVPIQEPAPGGEEEEGGADE